MEPYGITTWIIEYPLFSCWNSVKGRCFLNASYGSDCSNIIYVFELFTSLFCCAYFDTIRQFQVIVILLTDVDNLHVLWYVLPLSVSQTVNSNEVLFPS